MRKAGNEPEIVAYLAPHSDGNGAINFVLANVGKGPAFNVTFELSYDEDDFKKHNVMLVNDKERMPMSVIPQDDKISALFGISFECITELKNRHKPFRTF